MSNARVLFMDGVASNLVLIEVANVLCAMPEFELSRPSNR